MSRKSVDRSPGVLKRVCTNPDVIMEFNPRLDLLSYSLSSCYHFVFMQMPFLGVIQK